MSRYLTAFLTVAALVLPRAAFTYDVGRVKNGATIKVSVKHNGAVPENEIISVTEDPGVCGNRQEPGVYQVDGSKVKNAVVWLEGVDKGRDTIRGSVNIRIDRCRIEPRVSVGFVGGDFTFVNSDPILHTVQLKMGLAYQKKVSDRPLSDGATIYNIALPLKGIGIRKPIKRWHRYTQYTGNVRIRSSTHPWMTGYAFIFNHPYAGVTDKNGVFKLKDVPPGEYLLRIWHEGFGERERKVKVGPGQLLETDIDFGG